MNKENWDGLIEFTKVVLKGSFWLIVAYAVYVSALNPRM